MSAKHIVHCRVCGQEIDINHSTDWVAPSKNYYYHQSCYDNYVQTKIKIVDDIHADVGNELWFDTLYDYLTKDLKMAVDMSKVKSQWDHFLKKRTAKGIFFSIKYFYDVQHGDPTKTDGIGIANIIYEDACRYWVDREQQDAGICDRIFAQMQKARERDTVVIKQKRQTKKKAKEIDLASIGKMEDN